VSQSGTKEPKKEGNEAKGGGSSTGNNAKEGYQPGNGEQPKDTTDAATRGIDENGFQANGKKGGTADATSGDGASGTPAKYKGFWEKYTEELRRRTKNAPK
jgi:hypothetical protein